ncbi:MAG: HPr family phosphocarrier protein [Planctomycetes bacterium]|nr:HPr family phosphocarrier protein [Planctomycetota bacterium]
MMSNTSVKRTVVINHKFGIHARPAAKIVALCNSFSSDIEIIKEGEPPANGKNILDIMMLAAANGARLELRASGPDSEEAIDMLSDLMESDFDTDEV